MAAILAAVLSITMSFTTSIGFAQDGVGVSYADDPLTNKEVQEQKAMEPEALDGINEIDERQALEFDNAADPVGADDSSRYDPRGQAWFSNVHIKNQRETELCWACSLASAAEISYNKNNNGNGEELSAVQLAYFCCNRQNDPLGNTERDTNHVAGNYAANGGNPIIGSMSLETWQGYASETRAPFEDYTNGNNGLNLSADMAYQDDVIIKDMNRVLSPEDMKTFIRQNGSVIACLYYGSQYMDYKGGSFSYYSGMVKPNHAVTVVGWDDNYFDKTEAAKNFYNRNDGIISKGAWIVQNSWGTGWGDNGYFYVSYDESLSNIVTVSVEDADNYDKNYQYDGNSSLAYHTVRKGESVANVYSVDEKESSKMEMLTAVAFSTYDANETSYDIEIYTNVSNKNKPTSGELACSMSDVNVGKAGYHKILLPNTVMLEGGTSYSVVITAKRTSYIGVETNSDYGWFTCNAGLDKGQSFVFNNSTKKWKDLYSMDRCNRIKAFTKGVATVSLSQTDFEYDGQPHYPAVNMIMEDGRMLKEGEDFDVSYSNAKYPGTGKCTITGMGDFVGNIELEYTISAATQIRETAKNTTSLTLEWDKCPEMGYMIYRAKGSGKFSKVKTISDSDVTSWTNTKLSSGTTYKYKIRPYVKASKKTTYYGTYSDILVTVTKPLKSVMNKPTTGTSHYVKFSWKKKTGSGYELVVADNEEFENPEVYTITSSKTLSKKLLDKEKGVKYYAKVRAFKTCEGENIYGLYSPVKSITCK